MNPNFPSGGIVYNLFLVLPDLYAINALFVEKDTTGAYTHIRQKAGLHHLDQTEPGNFEIQKRLLDLVEQIQLRAIEHHFNAQQKKPRSLVALYADDQLKEHIQHYVQRRVNELLEQIEKYRLPLSREAEKRSLVKDMMLQFVSTPVRPLLSFRKTAEGIYYRLRLMDEEGLWAIRQRDVVPVTTEPAWIIVGYKICRLAQIKGSMVLPFRNKDELRIPQNTVKTYFQKVILPVASRVEIEAEGFEVITHETLLACRLEAVHDLFLRRYTLAVYMEYEQERFPCYDPRKERIRLFFGDGSEVRIIKVRRNQHLENRFLDQLLHRELEQAHGSHFQLRDTTDDPFQMLQWLCDHRQALEKAGFLVAAPETEKGHLVLETPVITWNMNQGNDWFDLYGEVRVENHVITFLELAPFIREGNRLFPLPEGKVFLIPLEWMSRFKNIAQLGKKHQNGLRILRSQRPMLEAIRNDLPAPVTEMSVEESVEIPPKLNATLRPYQVEGFQWLVQLYKHGLGACLADDMGLGKTLQTIAFLVYVKSTCPKADRPIGPRNLFSSLEEASYYQPLQALIVMPASLIFNWQQELTRFASEMYVKVHSGPSREKDIRVLASHDVILTTYQTALRDQDLLQKITWSCIILDESQQIKNKDSQVFKSLSGLSARHKVSLSGTPIENSLSDLWAQMFFINPGLLGTFSDFKKHYLLPIEKLQDDAQKESLRELVKPYLLRRTKEEVAKDLPPLMERIYFSEMTEAQAKLYEAEKSSARNFLLEQSRNNAPQYRILVQQTLMRLRQIVNHPRMILPDYEKESGKFQDVLEEWDVIRRGGHKVLFFSSFVKHLNFFKEIWEAENRPYSWLSGDLNAKQREAEVNKFQNDPQVQAFFISIKAGGTGLNLTAADYVFVLDPWWNPFVEKQAVARAHRIGQDKNVIALKFITRNSIEEKILNLQERKKQLAADIIEQAESGQISQHDLEYLLE
jgi:hypothetical protein